MATKTDLITEVVEGVLEGIKKFAAEDFAKLDADPAIKEKILQAVKATASETLMLAKEFAGQPQDIAKRIAKHLSEDRIKLIRGGLNIPTFRMEITRKVNGKHWLEFTREGKEFLPSDELASRFDVKWGITLQYANILIEAVLFVMSAVGIVISPSTTVIKKTVNETAAEIQSSAKMRRAFDDFVGAWDAAGDDPSKMAIALFDLIKESYFVGIIWNILKILCIDIAIEWYDWLETSAKVAAMIIATLTSDGTVLIAEISLIVLSAVDFALKVAKIEQLADIKKVL